nr:MAG TPA: hypothetical protein [Caudoviricetes sp.]
MAISGKIVYIRLSSCSCGIYLYRISDIMDIVRFNLIIRAFCGNFVSFHK